MALNFSHRPIFSAHLPEENTGQGGSQDKDIRELLPADPFGMDISSTVTAITGWLEDLGADYGGYGGAEVGGSKGDYPLFAGWNFWWNSAAIEFQTFPENRKYDDRIMKDAWVDSFYPEQDLRKGMVYEGKAGIARNLEGAEFGTTDNASFDRIDSHWKITGVDKHLPKGELGHLVYDGGVRFACFLDHAKFGTANDGFKMVDDNHGKSTRAAADSDHISQSCAKFGTANDSIYRVDDNHGQSIEAAADIDDISEACAKFVTANDSFSSVDDKHVKSTEAATDTDDVSEAPHPALSYALAYLGVRDLLSVERVCKSLCYTVQNDPLLWRSIHIDKPLSDRITDDVLVQLTNRAQGSLHCLSLVECLGVTDEGLKRVLEGNLRLTKLSVPGCTKLSIDCVVNCLRDFKLVAVNGIKFLRVGGLFDVTQKHYEELMSIIDIRNPVQNDHYKPHFYDRGFIYLSYEDDRPIDIEMCPRCQNLRLVYDCPVDGCQGKGHAAELCRACIFCIARCYQCGKCIDDCVYEETFFLELYCSDCLNQVSQCQESQGIGICPPMHAVSQEPVVSFLG